MAWQCQLDIFRRAGVEEMKQNTLAFANADGIAVTQGLAVDRKKPVPNFPAIRPLIVGFFGSFTVRFLPDGHRCGRFLLLLLFAVGQERFPLVGGQKNFLIIPTGVFARLDVHKTELARVGTAMEIRSGTDMGMQESCAAGARREAIPQMSASRYEKALLFGGTIHIGRNELAVPVR